MIRYLVFRGEEYRTNLQGSMKLSTLREVKREFGFGWSRVMNFVGAIGKRDEDGNLVGPPEELGELLTEDEFVAWIWAWIRNGGGEVTVEELLASPLDDFNFRNITDRGADPDDPDAGDSSPTPAPTPPATGSARGGAARKAAAKKAARKR